MRSKKPGIVLMLSMAVLMAMLAVGCNDTSEQADTPEPKTVVVTSERTVEVPVTVEKTVEVTEEQPSDDSEPTTQAGADITCEIGQECDLGESTITVTSAEQTQGFTAMGEPYEGNFIVAQFDYTYGGSASTDVSDFPFELLDGEGNRYSLNSDATISYEIENDRSLLYETVQPGVAASGAAIFEVAPTATDFTLLVSDLVAPQANSTAEMPLNESTETSPGSGENGLDANEEELEAQAEQAAAEYYQAAGLEDWGYTYDHLDSVTQSMFTEEEWFEKNQYFGDTNPVVYDILSVELLDDPNETITEVTVRLTGADGSSFTRTTYWVLENGEWLHRFGQEEIDTFTPGEPF